MSSATMGRTESHMYGPWRHRAFWIGWAPALLANLAWHTDIWDILLWNGWWKEMEYPFTHPSSPSPSPNLPRREWSQKLDVRQEWDYDKWLDFCHLGHVRRLLLHSHLHSFRLASANKGEIILKIVNYFNRWWQINEILQNVVISKVGYLSKVDNDLEINEFLI